MDEALLLDWLTLAFTPGAGPGRIRTLVNVFGSPGAALAADFGQLAEQVGVEVANQIRADRGRSQAELELTRFHRTPGVRIVPFTDPDYPESLLELNDFPVLLWLRGDLRPDLPKIGMVGTRSPSVEGYRNAAILAGELTRREYSIVSGMALGIDSASHTGALDEGGHTVAILGNGVDIVYPSVNRRLYERIFERGAVLSELPLQCSATQGSFQRRTRLISGISRGVVIVEAPEKSGALLTGNYAVKQRKPLMAVPGDITRKQAQGTNRLLREGAIAVTTAEEIISAVEGMRVPERQISRETLEALREVLGQNIPETEASGADVAPVPEADVTAQADPNRGLEVTRDESKGSFSEFRTQNSEVSQPRGDDANVMELLIGKELQFDDLVDQSGLPPPRLLSVLTTLEMSGIIVQLPGKIFGLRQGRR